MIFFGNLLRLSDIDLVSQFNLYGPRLEMESNLRLYCNCAQNVFWLDIEVGKICAMRPIESLAKISGIKSF